jgi:hypothetical protein
MASYPEQLTPVDLDEVQARAERRRRFALLFGTILGLIAGAAVTHAVDTHLAEVRSASSSIAIKPLPN